MQKLKITENLRQNLNESLVVVCTYLDLENNEIDCIDMVHQEDYPELEIVEVQSNTFLGTKPKTEGL